MKTRLRLWTRLKRLLQKGSKLLLFQSILFNLIHSLSKVFPFGRSEGSALSSQLDAASNGRRSGPHHRFLPQQDGEAKLASFAPGRFSSKNTKPFRCLSKSAAETPNSRRQVSLPIVFDPTSMCTVDESTPSNRKHLAYITSFSRKDGHYFSVFKTGFAIFIRVTQSCRPEPKEARADSPWRPKPLSC